jgi:hypothetical protein
MNKRTFLNKFGPWAVVTGASDGIGYAFAEQLAERGLNLVVVARRADPLTQLADKIQAKHGTKVQAIMADLSTPEGLIEVERVTEPLDVGLLVASAGYGTSGALLRANLKQERNMLDLNCYAVLDQCVLFGNRFAKRGQGGIILLSSLVGWQGVPQSAHYAATKAYVQSLAEALRLELRPKGVEVLASAPGPVRSGFAARANMAMGAAVRPEVVARASLNSLGKKGTVIPGALSKLLTYSLLPLPRFVRSLIMAQVMGQMTKHQSVAART